MLAVTGSGLITPETRTRIGEMPEVGRPMMQQMITEPAGQAQFMVLELSRRAEELARLRDLVTCRNFGGHHHRCQYAGLAAEVDLHHHLFAVGHRRQVKRFGPPSAQGPRRITGASLLCAHLRNVPNWDVLRLS